MSDTEDNSNCNNGMNQNVSNEASDEQIGNIVLQSVNLLGALMKAYADAEELQIAAASFTQKQYLINASDSEDPLDDHIYHLYECFDVGISSLIERENRKRSDPTVKMESEVAGHGVIVKEEEMEEQPDEIEKQLQHLERSDEEPNASDYDEMNEDGNGETLIIKGEKENSKRKRKVQTFECEICGKSYKSRQYLKIHMRSHLEDINQKLPFGCELCAKRYFHRGGLDKHIRTHSNVEEVRLPLKCDECGKRFGQSSHLNRHKLVHLDDSDPAQAELKRPYKCDVCGRRFTQSSDRKTHMHTHHSSDETEKRPFECNECEKKFKTKNNLRHHEKIHFAEDDPRRKKFECDFCGKFLVSANSLKYHKQIHSANEEERLPFKCDLCGNRFSQKEKLQHHKKRMHSAQF